MTQVMILTPPDDEIYEELTRKREELKAEVERDFANVQHPDTIAARNDCIGMLALDPRSIEKQYYVESANPRAPNPKFIQMSANAMADGVDQTLRPNRGQGVGG